MCNYCISLRYYLLAIGWWHRHVSRGVMIDVYSAAYQINQSPLITCTGDCLMFVLLLWMWRWAAKQIAYCNNYICTCYIYIKGGSLSSRGPAAAALQARGLAHLTHAHGLWRFQPQHYLTLAALEIILPTLILMESLMLWLAARFGSN